MTDRLAEFSVTYDGNESGDLDVVINAGSDKGFTVRAIHMNWQPTLMSGDSDKLPSLSVARFTSVASGGTGKTIFNHTDGDTAAASVLISPTALGSGRVDGPTFWPGSASYTGTGWYLHGNHYRAPLGEIHVAKNHSFWVRAAHLVSVTIHFHEELVY